MYSEQLETFEIIVRPLSLLFDHAFQGADGKSCAGVMERDGNVTAIRIPVMAMTAALPVKQKSVPFESLDDLLK